jgi:hypothetical protein
MRAVALVLLLLTLVAGCRSNRPKRDCRSVNREGWQFLKESFREGNRIRGESWKAATAFRTRGKENRHLRKASLGSAWESLWVHTWSEAGHAWRDLAGAARVDTKEIGYSWRFGHLDSGD